MGCPTVYNEQAPRFFKRYEAIDAVDIRRLLERWVVTGTRVLELGCGSGRDARFMKSLGARVTATDGSPALLELAQAAEKREASKGFPIRWIPLRLPPQPPLGKSPQTTELKKQYDLIFSSGLLQHLDDAELYRTALSIDQWANDTASLVILVPLDHPGDENRQTYTRDILDYVTLFERMGFREAFRDIKVDVGSPGFECHWATLVFLRAGKNDDAAKRFRTIIEDDAKTATYKLALLRAICSINRTMPRAVRFSDGKAVLPMSLVAEKWIEYYWQLAGGQRMPLQIRRSIKDGHLRDIAFLSQLNAVRTLCGNNWATFSGLLSEGPTDRTSQAAISALFKKVRETIKVGPMTYITDADNETIFRFKSTARRLRSLDRLSLLRDYGQIIFPAELWQELNRIAPWLEDSIVLEWARVSSRFEELGACEGKKALTFADIVSRMMPAADARDTFLARSLYLQEIGAHSLRCVWSRKLITSTDRLAVDHMLPWSRFHSNDLWNLMPALDSENGKKSDRIPSIEKLYDSRDGIIRTWKLLENTWSSRFRTEAEIALLGPSESLPTSHWSSSLFDSLLVVTDNSARQTQARRYD